MSSASGAERVHASIVYHEEGPLTFDTMEQAIEDVKGRIWMLLREEGWEEDLCMATSTLEEFEEQLRKMSGGKLRVQFRRYWAGLVQNQK